MTSVDSSTQSPQDPAEAVPPVDVLVDALDKTNLHSEPTQTHPGDNEKKPALARPMRIYTRSELLVLHNSPLVKPPPDMPELKQWFGVENEQNLSKKEVEPPTPNSTRERRFRRDAEDGDAPARPTFRSTVSQPSQMGNFKHQSLRSSDRDRERDRDRDGDKDRERDIRDKEGQERLRHLSDKYDRDRLALPISSLRNKERDTAPHLGGGSANRAGGQALSGTTTRRGEARESAKKKAGEASEDWRRGAEPSRPAREDRPDGGRRDREERERARSRGRDSSRSRREPSSSRRDRDDGKEKDRAPRGDRERDDFRRDRDRDADKDGDQDDPRRWRDDGKRDERIAARRATDRHGDREYRDRDRAARDRPPNDNSWDGDRRWASGEDRDGRYKRSTRDKKAGAVPEDGKDRDDRREREKEKEPAWMDTYIPNGSATGILGSKTIGGELDGIQAWKKEQKEKQQKATALTSVKANGNTLDDTAVNPSKTEVNEKQLDEIQIFKLMMKREEEKKKTETVESASSNDLGGKPVSHSKDVLSDSTKSQPQALIPEKSQEGLAGAIVSSIDRQSETDTSSSATLARSLPLNPVDVPSSSVPRGTQSLLSILGGQVVPNAPSNSLNASLPAAEWQQDSSRASSSSRLFPNPLSQDSAIQSAGPPALDASQFNPPPGSRVLAFVRNAAKSPAGTNSSSQPPNGTAQNAGGDLAMPISKVEGRSVPGFSPFDDQGRQSYVLEDQGHNPTLADPHRRPSATHIPLSQGDPTQDLGASGYAPAKGGSRFVKFFDGKSRDGGIPLGKAQTPVGFASPSPNMHTRQEQAGFNGMLAGSGDQRTMDDIFAMLNNSSQIQRGQTNHPASSSLSSNAVFGNQMQNNMHALQQQQLLHQQQLHANNRLEPLYESRLDDRNFMPDGMVPGLRPIHPPRGRDNVNVYPDEDSMHVNMQRLAPPPQRGLDSLYSGPSPPLFNQQAGRNPGLPLQQPHYRGGPSPTLNQQNGPQQRLPPGLANLGARPPHEPSQFLGLPGLPTGAPQGNLHVNGPSPHQQQPFNNFNNGNNNVGFGGPQLRGPPPTLHQLQNPGGHHPMGGIGHLGNLDPRLPNQNQPLGVGGVSRGVNGGFVPHQVPGVHHTPLLGMRQQQQQQPHLPPHMVPHLLHPHLQQQAHPGPNNQPAHDLMAILLGGVHRE